MSNNEGLRVINVVEDREHGEVYAVTIYPWVGELVEYSDEGLRAEYDEELNVLIGGIAHLLLARAKDCDISLQTSLVNIDQLAWEIKKKLQKNMKEPIE